MSTSRRLTVDERLTYARQLARTSRPLEPGPDRSARAISPRARPKRRRRASSARWEERPTVPVPARLWLIFLLPLLALMVWALTAA